MKPLLTVIICLTNVTFVLSQNVGIGDLNPLARLTIKGSESTVNGQNSAISITNSAAGGGSWYFRAGATGTTTPAGGLSIGDNAAYRLTINNQGNVGIGTMAPTGRLHISGGGIKIDGGGVLEFGVGITKEANAGKISYGNYMPNMLEIVGGGTTGATRSIRFFNEGGARFEGPINIVSGNITRSSTGVANLLPVAFGSVNTDGSVIGGSGNFSCVRLNLGFYSITVNNEFITETSHTIIITIIRNSVSGGDYAWATANTSDPGKFIVKMNNTIDQKFSFLLYKNN